MNLETVFQKIDTEISLLSFSDFTSSQKMDGSFITNLDTQIQEKIVKIISDTFPSHRIIYEEGEQKYLSTESVFTWIIDPIDGTGNLILRKNHYSISVGLMHKNRFVAAYVNFPALQEVYCSIFDSGVLRNWNKFNIEKVGQGSCEVVLCSKTFHLLQSSLRIKGYRPTCYKCATYSMLKVLNGEALLYHIIDTNIYDVGPMSYILSQCGIHTYNKQSEIVAYTPSLEKIPFLIATRNVDLLSLFKLY